MLSLPKLSDFKLDPKKFSEYVNDNPNLPTKESNNIVTVDDDMRNMIHDIHKRGVLSGIDPIFKPLSPHLKFVKGFIYEVAGWSNMGKSELVRYLALLQAIGNGSIIGIYAFEELSWRYIMKLCQAFMGKNIEPKYGNQCTQAELDNAIDFVRSQFFFFDTTCKDLSQDNILNNFSYFGAYLREEGRKMDMAIIDPMNTVDTGKSREDKESYLSDYFSRCIQFAQREDIPLINVAHPRTPRADDFDTNGDLKPFHPSKTSGGAMHESKNHHWMCYNRPFKFSNPEALNCEVKISKSKDYDMTGKLGHVDNIYYNPKTNRYQDEDGNDYCLPITGHVNKEEEINEPF